MKTVCIPGDYGGYGGPGVFQKRITRCLEQRGVKIVNSLDHRPSDVICLIGGQRDLLKLRRCHHENIRIVQRLNGINWMHRVRWTGLKHYAKSMAANFILRTIRSCFADHIVYQSRFSKDLWERLFGITPSSYSIVYNGVDLREFSPPDEKHRWSLPLKVMMIEGMIGSGYEHGLEIGMKLVRGLRQELGENVILEVAGIVFPEVLRQYEGIEWIRWLGKLSNKEIPDRLKEAHLFFSSDVHPACPNSVIEAMACGVPVIGYDTGALKEIVGAEGGRCVRYEGDPWKLESPGNETRLISEAVSLLSAREQSSAFARKRAENFGLEIMTEGYINAFLSE